MESGKKQELWEKLRRVGKRRAQTTPVASFWRRYETGDSVHALSGSGGGEEHDGGDFNENGPTLQLISSRKLAAALSELHRYDGDVNVTVPPPCLRRMKINHHRRSSPVSPHDTVKWNRGSNKTRMKASFYPTFSHHTAARKFEQFEEAHCGTTSTKSPIKQDEISYDTNCITFNIKLCQFNGDFNKPAVSPSISIELKGGTSTQLVKVLNRIWRLEEQHVADASLIKALKKDLHRARFQADRNHLDQLMKHIKEHDKIDAKTRNQRPYCSCKRASIVPSGDE